jgi:hypothetical protein
MPGSGLAANQYFGGLAGAKENQIESGLRDYASLIPTVSSTQTLNPALQAQIAETNALNSAAPDPGKAASYAQDLFQKYLETFSNPSGGTGSFLSSPWGQGRNQAPTQEGTYYKPAGTNTWQPGQSTRF